MASAKPIVVVKASLVYILCNPDHLAIYQDRVNTINSLVTAAYLLARYIFVHAYGEEESDRNDDNDSFNADLYDGRIFHGAATISSNSNSSDFLGRKHITKSTAHQLIHS